MRGRICAQKKPGVTAGCRRHECLTMMLALSNGQAVKVRAYTADKDCIAIDNEMMRGNGRRDVGFRLPDKINALFRRDVFQDDFQPG
jgi:hypothetical protein